MTEIADVLPANDVVSRTRSGAAASKPVRSSDGPATASTMVVWLLLFCAGIFALIPILRTAADELAEYALVNASGAVIEEKMAAPLPAGASADYLEAIAELALMVEPQKRDVALAAVRGALARDPDRAYAWAMLAYLEAEEAGSITPGVIEAVTRSMEVCGVCRQDLVRWRFNFVLTHWNSMPEPLRRLAVEHADVLRWTGNNGEFLAEMRFKAIQAGIPFDAYRADVNTPVRSWDIGPAPDASAD